MNAWDYGTYGLTDPWNSNALVLPSVAGGAYGYSLDEIEEYLSHPADAGKPATAAEKLLGRVKYAEPTTPPRPGFSVRVVQEPSFRDK